MNTEKLLQVLNGLAMSRKSFWDSRDTTESQEAKWSKVRTLSRSFSSRSYKRGKVSPEKHRHKSTSMYKQQIHDLERLP